MTAGLDGKVRTENDALIEAAQAAAVPTIVHEDQEGEYLIVAVPPGQTIETVDLSEYQSGPRRKKGGVVLHDAASFVAYVNRHKSAATLLYADRGANTVTAILNDHDDEFAGWGDHRATLKIALTREWQHWTGQDGKYLTQTQFAEHIEQGIEEIATPPAATMLDLAQHFEAHKGVAFKSVKLLADGSRQLNYVETVEAKAGHAGDVVIPKEFTLGIAPYEGTDAYKVTARLRYRLESEALKIGYTLVRPHDVLKKAFTDVLEEVKTGTDLAPLLGTYFG